MKRSERIRQASLVILLRPFLLLSLIGFLTLGAPAQMSGQSVPSDGSSMVTFHVNPSQSFVPIKVVRVMLGDKEIPLDTPVPVEGMWMRKFQVTIQNVSSKAIVLCDIAVMFPETFAIASPVPSFRVGMGTPSKHSLMRKDGT